MKLHVEREINFPAKDVWALLGKDFTKIGDWFSLVNFSRGIGAEEMPAGYKALPNAPILGRYTESAVVKATEVLTLYSDERMEFIFHAVDVPKFMLSLSQNHTRVKALGDSKSLVTIDVEMGLRHIFNILSPILKLRMTRLFTTLLDELETHLARVPT